MNRSLRFSFLICVCLACMFVSGYRPVRAESVTGEGRKEQGPMVIKSKTLEADDRKGQVTFSGDVEARREDFTVFCQNLVVLYKKDEGQKDEDEVSARIDKIVATGHVKIIRSDGGVATGEKAVYYQKVEKLVLTGEPVVKRGEDFVEGDVITLFLKEDRSIVESAGDKKVKAVIFPGKGDRQKP